MTKIAGIVAEVKITFAYVCDVCGTACIGSSQCETIEAFSTNCLAAEIDAVRCHAGNVREGWSSLGSGKFRCPECKEKARG